LRSEQLDLRQTTRSSIEALGPYMAERGTRLEVEIPDRPFLLVGDDARLQQIQANLLSNASKYSPRGGQVRLQLSEEDGEAVIRVSDEGRGIEQHMLPKIFDLFVQGEQSLARSEGGLGIGLTLLRSLVELHHGRVEALSDGPGKGSTFIVRLPLATRGTGRPPAIPAAPQAVRTVALIEDQADARRMMQFLLEAEGVQVVSADNGADGAALIERVKPELALVDLGLPVMSGFELARRVRQNRDNDVTRLIALSGYGQDSDVQAALEAGFDEHLTKPPDPSRLEQLIKGRGIG
jgi:two-component system CheB/CheR fusion protein